MPITALQGLTPPSTDDPSNFDSRADAFLGAMPDFADQANDLEDNVNAKEASTVAAAELAEASASAAVAATAYVATSNTSLSLTAGAKAVTLQESGRAFTNGDRVWLIRRGDENAGMAGVVSLADMAAKTMTVTVSTDILGSGGPYTDWMVVHADLKPSSTKGKHALWIPAASMMARTTNGAATGTTETTTNKVMLRTLDFDASTIEYAQFAIQMPRSWDEGTVTFVPVWSHAATTTNFKVSWGLQAVAIGDDDTLDAAFGTAQYSNDTGGTTNDLYIGPESSAVTVAGTPQPGDWVTFQVLRKADDATNDTLAIDARLHGLTVILRTNADTDA